MDRNDVKLEQEVELHNGFFRMVRLHLRHRLFAGGWGPTMTREVVRHGQVAAIIPYDPIRDTVILIEQFRAAIYAAGDAQPWSISIAAGMVEPGESAEEMARRETLEETGCTVARLEKASEFYSSPGGSSQYVTLFCGEISTEGAGGLFGVVEETEDIRAFVKTADEAIAMADSGAIDNAISILGLHWLARNKDDLRARWT